MIFQLTIAIPTYNRAICLGRAINSALAQTDVNIEILVLDNASTDDTEAVMTIYLDNPAVVYYRNNLNIGATANYNQCLDRARGEYFMILGDDDWLAPNYAKVLIDTIKKNNQIFLGKCVTINQDGAMLSQSSNVKYEITGLEFYSKFFDGNVLLARHTWFMLAAKTSSLRMINGFPSTEAGQHSDNLLLLKLMTSHTVIYNPEAIIYYSCYPESYGNSNIKSVSISALQSVDFWDREIAPPFTAKYGRASELHFRSKLISFVTNTYTERVFLYGKTLKQKLDLLATFPNKKWLMRPLFNKLLWLMRFFCFNILRSFLKTK